jgi:ribose transport system permease protein
MKSDASGDATVAQRKSPVAKYLEILSPRRISAIYLAIVFLVLFSLLNPGTYLTGTTTTVVFNGGVVTCLLALAFLIPLVAGAYDLSIAAILSLSVVICVKLSTLSSPPPEIVIALIAMAAGALTGIVNGFIIVKLRVDSFIATLGMSEVLLAVALLLTNNEQIIGRFSRTWSNLGNDKVIGIPLPMLYLVAVGAVIWYVLEYTPVGRYLFATGGNPEGARLAGVRTDRLLWGSLIASGTIAGFAGVVSSMQVSVATAGSTQALLFPAVTAVFLGASQFSQRPNVWGTLIAYFALAFGVQGLTLTLGSSSAWASPAFQGVALIVAVAVASRPIRAKLRDIKEKDQGGSPTGDGASPQVGRVPEIHGAEVK